jgi:hypothetical protein
MGDVDDLEVMGRGCRAGHGQTQLGALGQGAGAQPGQAVAIDADGEGLRRGWQDKRDACPTGGPVAEAEGEGVVERAVRADRGGQAGTQDKRDARPTGGGRGGFRGKGLTAQRQRHGRVGVAENSPAGSGHQAGPGGVLQGSFAQAGGGDGVEVQATGQVQGDLAVHAARPQHGRQRHLPAGAGLAQGTVSAQDQGFATPQGTSQGEPPVFPGGPTCQQHTCLYGIHRRQHAQGAVE